MSCEAGFTDSRCNEQTTDVVWRGEAPQACATHKNAVRELDSDIETASAILKAAIEDVVEGLDCTFSLFEDCERDPKNADRIRISMRSLEVLKRKQEEAEAAIAAVFKDHGWELRRAMRTFKEAIARETAP
jgi:hypothetical protein